MTRARWIAAVAGLACAGLVGGLPAAGASPTAAAAGGIITTIAGGPGQGLAREVGQTPDTAASGLGGSIYVGDGTGVVRKLNITSGAEERIAGQGQADTPGMAGPRSRPGWTALRA